MAKSLGIEPPSKTKSADRKAPARASNNITRPESGAMVALNFKVSAEFKQEFKLWAATHQMSQKDALVKGFELLKKRYS